MKIIVSGGTGFIGRALVQRLTSEGHKIIIFTRSEQNPNLNSDRMTRWDAKTMGPWAKELEGADAVIHLAGESIVAKRWSPEQKIKIKNSRIHSTRILIEAIERCSVRPRVLINASAVGYYGNVREGSVTEDAPKGKGFLADVCEVWENEARQAEVLGVRTVYIRTGVVLEKDGGALSKMLPPFILYIGGPLGSGKQWFPWIHRDDVIEILIFIINHAAISGPVNVVAPHPVRMRKFCKTLGKALKRPSWAPVPAFVLRTLLGEMSEMLLEGQRAIPEKLLKAGYPFRYPKLDEALDAILNPQTQSAMRLAA